MTTQQQSPILQNPSSTPRPDWLDPSRYPFESRFIDIDGNSVHFVDEGQGPVLLFLHSNLSWSFLYRDVIRGLRDRFRCIALDYPGYGLSAPARHFGFTLPEHTRIVEQFVLALDLRDATLMVHDAGGPIGLPVAAAHPDRFRALIVADTFAWPLQDTPRVARMVGVIGGPLFGFVNTRTNVLLRLFLRFGIRRRSFDHAERAAYLGPFRERSARDRIHTLFAGLVRREEELAKLHTGLERLRDKPVLIIFGEHDPARREGFQARWEGMFPHHRSIVIPDAAHFSIEEAPEEIVVAINAWWDTVEVTQRAA